MYLKQLLSSRLLPAAGPTESGRGAALRVLGSHLLLAPPAPMHKEKFNVASAREIKDHSYKRDSSRRHYEKRKATGRCAYFGCRADAETGRRYCQRHLEEMSRNNRKRCKSRKEQGLCIYCGLRPQFWGVRCLVCRQRFNRDPRGLPLGARRALRLYREAERLFELEQLQTHARFAIRKFLAAGEVTGDREKVLRLYAGLDTGRWRTYQEVGRLMHLSKERVRQLLNPSKAVLTEMLDGNVPWKPPTVKAPRPAQVKRTTPYRSVPNTTLFTFSHQESQ